MTDAPIRVVLIDDSAVVRGALRQIIDAAPDMKVVGTASNGRLGLDELTRVEADVVLLDIEMPELDGLATLPRLLAAHPRVRVIMASSLTHEGARVTMDALAIGAADYITKPTARAGPVALESLAAEIVSKIRALGSGRRRRIADRPSPPTPRPGTRPSLDRAETPAAVRALHLAPASTSRPRVVAVASSTGGPNALAAVMRTLPRTFTLPVLITQHMPPLFTELLAQRLHRESGRLCVEAPDGAAILDNRVYVAPGNFHMLVELRDALPHIRLSSATPENHCRPAADPMLRSVVDAYGSGVLAVVLTGMGEDARRGCEMVRRAGGRVIVQDEASSVVWGMPGVVATAGLAERILPLGDIGAAIGSICGARA